MQNYQASLKLEGITTTAQTTQQSKAEILQKYKKYSQPETLVRYMYGEMGDSLYCYPGTNILKNKLNIRDEQILEQAELELSGLASNLIEYAEPPYDLQYLKKSIHAQLFGDLYDWAGKLRQIVFPKVTPVFVIFSRIESETNKLLKSLQEKKVLSRLSTTITNSSTCRLVL